MTDIEITPSQSTATVSGDRARELLDLLGHTGWQVPLDALPALRAAALTQGWTVLEHPRFVARPDAGPVDRRPPT